MRNLDSNTTKRALSGRNPAGLTEPFLSDKLLSTSTIPLNPAGQAAAPFNIAQTTFSYYLSTTGVSRVRWWNRGFFVPNSAGAKVLLGAKDLPADLASGAEIGPGGQFGKGASASGVGVSLVSKTTASLGRLALGSASALKE